MAKAIFEIPEIVLNIAKYLSPADLAQACRVSRSWFVPFVSQLWRSIQLDQWIDGNLAPALPRYSAFVRELRCPRYIEPEVLGAQFEQLTLFRAPLLDNTNIDIFKQILRENPNINSLWVVFDRPLFTANERDEFFESVAGMSKLRSLHFSGLGFPVYPGELAHLLNKLTWLKTLVLEECYYSRLPRGTEPTALTIEQSGHLRSLSTDCFREDTLDIILEITQCSPQLEQLVMLEATVYRTNIMMSPRLEWFAEKLHSYCQHLDQLKFHACDLDQNGLACLLSAFPKLRKFEFTDCSMKHGEILAQIIQHESCRDSFEEISLQNSSSRMDPTCADEVFLLLRKFTKLKKVSLTQCKLLALDFVRSQEEFGYVLASRDLQVLSITITGPNKKWAPPEVFPEKYTPIRDDAEDEDHDLIQVPDYHLYNAVMEEFERQPKLDRSAIRFDYSWF
ncbi:hypothetical protein BGZ65_003941 [Modicella reniformis]|uniref:F-box domain-containing protein n=1 Tax=Modicella reniformis TaxID=1440133 RepID=A0A9P6M937_9FUNG|nr:hypothetical protein BGZ65_003941 [Modicella reniformis]